METNFPVNLNLDCYMYVLYNFGHVIIILVNL